MADGSDRAARFDTLLIVFVVLYAAAPFLPDAVSAWGLPRIAIALTLVGAVWHLGVGRTVPMLVTAVMIVNEIAHAALAYSPGPTLALVSAISMLFFLAAAVGFLAWFFWHEEQVGAGFLSGAVCAYLLLGFFWADSFRLLELVEPGSFRDLCAPWSRGAPACDAATGEFGRFDYFGFTTMTTLGYGDIVPLTHRAERLTSLSAVTGQLFIAVLIGRIVANFRPARGGD